MKNWMIPEMIKLLGELSKPTRDPRIVSVGKKGESASFMDITVRRFGSSQLRDTSNICIYLILKDLKVAYFVSFLSQWHLFSRCFDIFFWKED